MSAEILALDGEYFVVCWYSHSTKKTCRHHPKKQKTASWGPPATGGPGFERRGFGGYSICGLAVARPILVNDFYGSGLRFLCPLTPAGYNFAYSTSGMYRSVPKPPLCIGAEGFVYVAIADIAKVRAVVPIVTKEWKRQAP